VPDQLMRWYADPNAQVMTILYGDQRAGFAMVTSGCASRPASAWRRR
jgi:hypothetical protein